MTGTTGGTGVSGAMGVGGRLTTGDRSKRGFWILISVLAASGVAIALIVALGLFDSITYSLTWRVFVADLYLIASLAAQHTWLRRAVWIGAGVTFVLGIVNAAWDYTPFSKWADGRTSITAGDPSTGWSPWFGFEDRLEGAGHFVVGGLVLLGFISFAYRWISASQMLRTIYYVTFAVAGSVLVLGVLLILDSPWWLDLGSAWSQLQMGLIILALTGAAIVIIAGVTQRNAARAAARSLQGAGIAAGTVVQNPRTPQSQQVVSDNHASPHIAALPEHETLARLTEVQLRELVRKHVDEYLNERGI